MSLPPRRAPLDYDALAEHLAALAYPLRLAILDVLDIPHTLSDIRVRPHKDDGGNPERTAAKQTVLAHLERLVEVGLVLKGQEDRGGRVLPTYTVNPQALYALTEDLRRVSVRHGGRGRGLDHTGTLPAVAPPRPALGPRLVLVHGLYEGRTYPLQADTATEGRWTIGRRAGIAVSLDYDPFVSLENATIARRGQDHLLTDHADSKNGTHVNWEYLERGSTRTLRRGDVIGIGRSLLNFYDA